MEKYETEEQQVEAIKRFWKENGIPIVVGAALGLGGLFGWRYYNESVISAQEQASTAYDAVNQNLIKNEAGFSRAQSYIDENSESGYALLLAFKLAQQAAERKDLTEAAKQLNFAANSAENTSVQAIANLRLARVQLEQGMHDQALATLDKVSDDAFLAQRQETKGDVYQAQQLFDKARAAYSSALEANASNSILKMKLDNLATLANG
ncbi:MAG: putative negative regulator of RcsB-dependent stress response [Paraglaciecola sp.]|jgi:predicted negative regulator of RcsB-dependent stress response